MFHPVCLSEFGFAQMSVTADNLGGGGLSERIVYETWGQKACLARYGVCRIYLRDCVFSSPSSDDDGTAVAKMNLDRRLF